ncbi:MAG TPA: 4-hydroxy-3-methylbut-2-en-1-yl diphosphate synthase, partial [Desulfurivibrio alkaliphilus]|nr:4-hydroxy-3-methylbut-2-en-1-yl diphosphate synthase [Desulfurivibrio alkaliphilus]
VGIIFKKGKILKKVPENQLLAVFLAEIDKMTREQAPNRP